METRILLQYNYWEWKALAILSLLIKIFTYGPNHAAILKDGQVHEMVGSSFSWTLRKLLGFKVSYAPNEGSGYKITPYDVWLKSAKRQVIVMQPLVEVVIPDVTEGYGYLDLIQIFLHIARTKWFLTGHDWNGTDGCRLWPGMFCSEFIGKAIGRPDAHILTPADLQFIPELKKVNEFVTSKQ